MLITYKEDSHMLAVEISHEENAALRRCALEGDALGIALSDEIHNRIDQHMKEDSPIPIELQIKII